MNADAETPPLRAAHIFLSMPVGGAEDLTVGLMSQMPPSISVIPICLRQLGPVGEEVRKTGREIHHLPVAPTKRLNLPGILRLSRWLREHRIRVVHTQVYHAHVYGVLAAWRAGIPAIIHHQKTYRDLKWRRTVIMRWLTRLAAAQITLSEKSRADICAAFKARPEEVFVLPNAVDTSRFRPAGDRAALRMGLGLPPHAFLVGTVASLTHPKNHAANLAMWAAARQSGVDGCFVLCGEGPLRDELARLRDSLGLQDSCQFLGNRRPVHPWMQALDLFVLCSTWEGQPLAILQAMACQIPVIASRIEGNVAALGADHPGLFSLEDPAEFPNRVLRCYKDPSFRQAILDYQQHRSPKVMSVGEAAVFLSRLYHQLASP